MNLPAHLAKHLRDVHFGGNWTTVNLKDSLAGVNWKQATTQVHSFNTIATLVAHTHYYIMVVQKVLRGEPLTGKDADSFGHPPVRSESDWQDLLATVWADAGSFAAMIEQLPEPKLWEDFYNGKYGNYYRNITGIIEHTHYHLGQIVLIKKILAEQATEGT